MPKETQNDAGCTSELFTVIEIGTETVKVLIGGRASEAKKNQKPAICIYGIGKAISNNTGEGSMPLNIRKGEIINVDKVRQQIELAIQEAEADSAMDVRDTNLYVGISGKGIHSENIEATVSVKDRHVTSEDLLNAQVIAYEKGYSELQDKLIQVSMRYFKTEQGITYDVSNQVTRNLHAYTQAAVCTSNQKYFTLKRMIKEATACSEPIFLYTPTLPCHAKIDELEREKHSLFIDIGAGLTSFAITSKPGIIEFGHIPIGCNHIENDLMLGLEIDWEAATHVVRRLKSIMDEYHSDNGTKTVRLRHKGGQKEREVPMESIISIVETRVEEIFQLVKKELLTRNSWDLIHGTVFISGGGALLPEICATASRVLELPAEIARPGEDIDSTTSKDFLEDPRWIAPIGMMRMAITQHELNEGLKDSNVNQGSVIDIIRKFSRIILNW